MTETTAPIHADQLLRTPLHALHVELGGRMVAFAGWSMPVQFPAGVTAEHHHCRSSAVLFDVSHMGQIVLRPQLGSSVDDVASALESLVPADIAGLSVLQQRYGLFLDERAGILDDLMITRRERDFFLVVNASNVAADLEHLRTTLPDSVEIEFLGNKALLALQGPQAVEVLRQLDTRTDETFFMTGAYLTLDGVDCFVTRSGYTGEDGFEISVPAEQSELLARRLLTFPEVEPAGLGARDTLRLEAGLCLHGHDISPDTTPVEAALAWAIPKVRRPGGERAGGYPGAAVVAAQFQSGVTRKRVGLVSLDRVPVREGALLLDEDGRVIGEVTSGTLTPTAGHPVAMGYVVSSRATAGTPVIAQVRDKPITMTVTALPIVEHRYVRRPSANQSTKN